MPIECSDHLRLRFYEEDSEPMAAIPLSPKLKYYRGGKESIRRKTAEFNAKARRIADHVNRLMADNPREIQQYMFASIARDLGFTTDEVRNAISDGGYNGITLGVRGQDREALERYRSQDTGRITEGDF